MSYNFFCKKSVSFLVQSTIKIRFATYGEIMPLFICNSNCFVFGKSKLDLPGSLTVFSFTSHLVWFRIICVLFIMFFIIYWFLKLHTYTNKYLKRKKNVFINQLNSINLPLAFDISTKQSTKRITSQSIKRIERIRPLMHIHPFSLQH